MVGSEAAGMEIERVVPAKRRRAPAVGRRTVARMSEGERGEWVRETRIEAAERERGSGLRSFIRNGSWNY